MASSGLSDLDPTGTLSAVGAGVSLVGAALRLGTAAKKFQDAHHTGGSGGGGGGGGGSSGGGVTDHGPSNLHRSQTSPNEIPTGPKDPERERRAYETVNFVLREFGSRICAAGMVDEHALTKALTAATQHIEVNLFSGETNRLFESLAPKLADPILVNSVFTSIYFIGALTAELSTSVPNYKDAYVPVGPRLVQQLFRAAIGEDAFKDNLTANLDAYKTLTTTAGLLRPTDIGYLTFPRFPSFAPSRYSSRSLTDVHRNRSTYEKLVKHFERVGFPQPTPARQAEVGVIRDWKFLSGESNSRAFDVEKADRNIGENFGRVLYWLICSAERLPPGQAVIAYYDQHIELINWIQHRMGYAVLYPAFDLNLGGPHGQLERKLRATIDSWVILMPSEAAQAAKRANAEHWMATHLRNAARALPFAAPNLSSTRPISMAVPQVNHASSPPIQSPPLVGHTSPSVNHVSLSAVQGVNTAAQVAPTAAQAPPPARQPSQASSNTPSVASMMHSTNRASIIEPHSPPTPSASSPPTSPAPVEMPTLRDVQPVAKTLEQQIEEILQHFRNALVPQFQRLWLQPSADPGIRDSQCNVLAHTIERETIDRLDRIHIPENHLARMHRKSLIDQAQELLNFLPVYKDLGSTATHGRPLPGALQTHVELSTATAVAQRPSFQGPQSTGFTPPPYSPASPPSAGSSAPSAASTLLEKPKSNAFRRKAPPPPKFIPAKALYDFEADPDNAEELGFAEDDEIEIIEKNAVMEEHGWCRARIKGSKRIGLVPLEYLQILEKKPAPAVASNKSLPQHASPQHMPPPQTTAPSLKASPSHSVPPPHPMQTSHNVPPSHNIPQPNFAYAPGDGHTAVTATPNLPPAQQQSATPISSSSAYQQSVINVSRPTQYSVARGLPASAQPIPSKTHVGKFEAASPATASLGAAAKVGTLVEGMHSHGLGTHGGNHAGPHQQQSFDPGRDGQNNSGVQDTPGGDCHNNMGDQANNGVDYQNVAGDQVAVASGGDSDGINVEQDSPQMVDLSAFGEAPFTPQASLAGSVAPTAFGSGQYYVPQETFAQQTTEADFSGAITNDYSATTTTTDISQDNTLTTFLDGPAALTSPFASLATSSTDTSTYTDTTVSHGDGTTSTYNSFTDDQTTYTTDLNDGAVTDTDQTQWSAGAVDDDDGYDLDY